MDPEGGKVILKGSNRNVNLKMDSLAFSDQSQEMKTAQGSYHTQPVPSAGKWARAACDWFWFCFSLTEKVARVLSINHRAK